MSPENNRHAMSALALRLGLAILAPLSRLPGPPRRLARRLARFYASRGRQDLAIAVLQRALARCGAADSGLLHQLGVSQLETGALEDAAQSFRQATALRPNAAWSHQALGQALKAQCLAKEAEAALRKAIELQPDSLWAWYHLSDSLFLQGRVGAALDAVIAGCVMVPFPGIPFPIQSLPAEACTAERITALRRLVERHPDAFALMALLSWMLTARRDFAESVEMMRRMAPLHWRLDDDGQATEPTLREPPAFMVIGQPAAGAGPLFRCLDQHARYVPQLFRKCHYWSRHFAGGDEWHQACLPPLCWPE